MSLLQCSKSLFRPSGLFQRPSIACYGRLRCTILRRCADFQTRHEHNRPSQRKARDLGRFEGHQIVEPWDDEEAKKLEQYTEQDKKDGRGYQHGGEEPPWFNHPVNFLGPAAFALFASFAIYTSFAVLEAKRELAPERLQDYIPQWQPARRTPPTPSEVVTRAWNELNPMAQLTGGLIATNSAVHLTKFVAPRFWTQLWHVPANGRIHSLFTSMFVHGGPMHLGINMYAAWNFLPAVGYSKAFRGDIYHMSSFYLAAGLLSGYAQHVASAVFRQGHVMPPRWTPSGGASGALFAVLGVFCTQYPTQGVGIIFVPYYMDAQYVLPAVMLFDFVGMVRGYKFANLGHAVRSRIRTTTRKLTPFRRIWEEPP
jgi:rhomboid-like protein